MSTPRVASALVPVITEQGDDLDLTWWLYFWLSVGVVALIAGLMAYLVVRFRQRSDELPRQKHYNIQMEITYTVLPLLLVLALTAVTFVTVEATERDADGDELLVAVTAFQWQWRFAYPEYGIEVTGGPQPDQVPELILPAGAEVTFELESLDVIHSFWVTVFRFKRDMIPGQTSRFTVDLTDDAAGWYPNAGVCAEFCGLDHARMRFGVRVLEPDEFEAWVAQRSEAAGSGEPAGEPVSEDAP